MSLSRVVVLGLLAEHGPMHGHQLRRRADSMHVESWGGVTPGALYRELHQLEAEGLIELVRSEQVGRRPPRAVYRISRAGQAALRILSEEALTVYSRPPDIVGVGLLFGALEGPGDVLALLENRRAAAVASLDALVVKRARLEEADGISASVRTVFRRSELSLQAELTWHEEYRAELVKAAVSLSKAPLSRRRTQRVATARHHSAGLETTSAVVEISRGRE